jgi:hypothetical protein
MLPERAPGCTSNGWRGDLKEGFVTFFKKSGQPFFKTSFFTVEKQTKNK